MSINFDPARHNHREHKSIMEPVNLKINKEIERANDVIAFTLISRLYLDGKISERAYLNIQKDVGITVKS